MDESVFIIGAIVSIVSALITMEIYKSKNRPAWNGFALGLFLGVIGIVIALIQPAKETSFGKRKCPYCAERIRPEAQVCKHCGRDLPPAFTIPAKYSVRQLPPSEAKAIRRKSPEQNLGAAKRFIKRGKWHQAIASLQVVISESPPSSEAYGEAYGILYEMLGGHESVHHRKAEQDAVSHVAESAQCDDASSASTTATSVCPVCGVQMDIRTANRGEHEGKRFYVCPNYPKCKQVIPID